MPVQVLHGIRSNANSLRSILPPPIPPRRVSRLWRHHFRLFILLIGFLLFTSLAIFNANLLILLASSSPLDGYKQQQPIPIPFNEQQHSSSSSEWFSAFMSNIGRLFQADSTLFGTPAIPMALGASISALPFAIIFTKFGARLVLPLVIVVLLLLSSIPLFPLLNHFWANFILFFVQGIASSAQFVLIGQLCANWASVSEVGLFLSPIPTFSLILSGSSSLSSIANSPSSSFASSILVLIPVFSLLFCLLLLALWFLLYSNNPLQSANVTHKELEWIRTGKQEQLAIPTSISCLLLHLLSSPFLWVCSLNAFAHLLSSWLLLQYNVHVNANAQHFNSIFMNTGWVLALSFVLHSFLKFCFGLASDWIRCISERSKLIMFNSLALGVPGFCYLGISFCPFPFQFSLLLFIFSSASVAGFFKSAILVFRQFGHFALAIIHLAQLPNLADHGQWRPLLAVCSALCLLANLLFCLMATDQPADFTEEIGRRRRKGGGMDEGENHRKNGSLKEQREGRGGRGSGFGQQSCCHFSIGEEE